MNAIDNLPPVSPAAAAKFAATTAAIRAAVLADPIAEAANTWSAGLDWYTIVDAHADRVGDILEAVIDYGGDCSYRHEISLANLPADPFARFDVIGYRLDDFQAGVDDLTVNVPVRDHTAGDLARAIGEARARRLVGRVMRDQDSAALLELLALLAESRKS